MKSLSWDQVFSRRLSRNDVKNALWKERSLIKTYGLRGTLYLFPAEDASLWMAALKAGRGREDPRRIEWQGINAKEILKIVDAIADSLDDNRLTRDELGEEIARRLAGPVGRTLANARRRRSSS